MYAHEVNSTHGFKFTGRKSQSQHQNPFPGYKDLTSPNIIVDDCFAFIGHGQVISCSILLQYKTIVYVPILTNSGFVDSSAQQMNLIVVHTS